MPLELPPKALLRCDTENAHVVHRALTEVIAERPRATTTYQFYEDVDAWLGPWGRKGYPIGYGKFYNIAFTTSRQLMADETTREWVRRTTILLQEALRDFVVAKVRDGSLPSLTEPELRRAAFASHPRAYDQAGLARVALVAPELLVVIATIPRAEFHPDSADFQATVEQVGETFELVAPEVVEGAFDVARGRTRERLDRRSARLAELLVEAPEVAQSICRLFGDRFRA